jgi:hypothetical protein
MKQNGNQAINQMANTHKEPNKINNIYAKDHNPTSPRAERPQVHKTRPYSHVSTTCRATALYKSPSLTDFNPILWMSEAQTLQCSGAVDDGLLYGRIFGRVFGRIFGCIFSHIFGRIFGRIFDRVFGRIFGRIFSRIFGRIFSRIFGRIFGRIFDRVFGRIVDRGVRFVGRSTKCSAISIFVAWLLLISWMAWSNLSSDRARSLTASASGGHHSNFGHFLASLGADASLLLFISPW